MSFYETNISLIEKNYPGLIQILENTETGKYEQLEARNGSPTIRKEGIFLHSGHNPDKEAEKLISREILAETQFCLFYGFGLGYHIEAFQKTYPEKPFGVIEPDPTLFKQALNTRDFSPLLRNRRMSLLIGTEPESATVLLNSIKTSKIQTCLLRSIYQTDKEYYDRLDRIVRDYIAKREINTNTHNRFNRLWISNICRNAPLLSRAPGISRLKEMFSDKPALLIAAGPSLDRLLPYLPALKKRLLLVCVDTALKACLKSGVEPDFTVMTDPQYWNTRHLDRCRLHRSILISDVSTYPTLLRQTGEFLFFCSTPFPLAEYLESKTEVKGKLKSGGSVATAAWDLIRLMGCSRIYCAGLDLSFPSKQTHYRGSTFEERVHTLSGRFQTGESAGWQALHDGNPYLSLDYNGEPVLTDQRMKIYISWFEKQMSEHKNVLTRNLSTRGVKLEGMPPCEWEELLTLPEIRESLNLILRTLKTIQSDFGEEKIFAALSDLTGEMEEMAELTARGLTLTEGLKDSLSPEVLGELEEIDRKILTTGSREIAGFFILPLLEDFLGNSSEDNDREKIIDRSRIFYETLQNSLNFQLKHLHRIKKTVFS